MIQNHKLPLNNGLCKACANLCGVASGVKQFAQANDNQVALVTMSQNITDPYHIQIKLHNHVCC